MLHTEFSIIFNQDVDAEIRTTSDLFRVVGMLITFCGAFVTALWAHCRVYTIRTMPKEKFYNINSVSDSRFLSRLRRKYL